MSYMMCFGHGWLFWRCDSIISISVFDAIYEGTTVFLQLVCDAIYNSKHEVRLRVFVSMSRALGMPWNVILTYGQIL
jgi:hypothetical protein